jgi:hypothetical protein
MSNGPSAIREQKERASVLKNEQKVREGVPTTLFARARAGLDSEDVPGGRYAAQQNHFPGDPSVGYPPAAGWTRDAALVPPEPSLGVAIDEMEVTGTAVEVARSLNELASPTVVSTAGPNSQMSLAELGVSETPCSIGAGHPSPAEVLSCSSAREASPPADPTAASGSVPPASSPDVSDRGGEANPSRLKRRRL